MRSINNSLNFSKLESLIYSLQIKPCIIPLTETWLKPNQPGMHINLVDYTFVSNSRLQFKGGGVGMYINNILNFIVRDDLNIMDEKIFESLFIEVEYNKSIIICGVIYRAPFNDSKNHKLFIKHLTEVINKIKNKPCFLFGDFNYNLLDCNDVHTNNFSDILFENCYLPLINKPTRFTSKSASLLDHIWTNINLDNNISAAIITHPLSDHLPVYLCYDPNLTKTQPEPKQQRLFSNSKIALFNNEIQNLDIEPILTEDDPETSFNILMNDYMILFNKHFPKVTLVNDTKKNSWFDKELKQLLTTKETLFKKYIHSKSIVDKIFFNKTRNIYFRKIQQKKQDFIKNRLEHNKNDIRSTWNIMNNLLGKNKTPECKLLSVNSKKIIDPQHIANIFNNHFSSIATKLTDSLPKYQNDFSEYLGPRLPESIYIWPTCPMEVKNILKNTKSKLSAGLDEIPWKLLKSSPENVIIALSHIFNLSLQSGKIISTFKTAKVIPLYKKGDASDINNYRPISLLSNISKILEKIMHQRVINFLNRHNFFFQNQFGFRKNHSTSSHFITY